MALINSFPLRTVFNLKSQMWKSSPSFLLKTKIYLPIFSTNMILLLNVAVPSAQQCYHVNQLEFNFVNQSAVADTKQRQTSSALSLSCTRSTNNAAQSMERFPVHDLVVPLFGLQSLFRTTFNNFVNHCPCWKLGLKACCFSFIEWEAYGFLCYVFQLRMVLMPPFIPSMAYIPFLILFAVCHMPSWN